MRITRQTVSELVLEDSTIWLAVVLAAISLPLFYTAMAPGKKGNLLVGGFLLLCAAICIRKVRAVFDAAGRVVRWRKLVFLRTSSGTLPFDEIRDIAIDSAAGNSGRSDYRLTIVTSGKAIPLSSTYSPGHQNYAAMRATILQYVHPGSGASQPPAAAGSPMTLADLEPSLRELIRNGRTIDAITLLRSLQSMSLTEARARVNEIKGRMKG